MAETQETTGIIYCRVSSKEQVDGTSLETQERSCREYAARSGIRLLRSPFIEQGESAKTADRTEFNKAIAYCTDKKNRVGYFIVYKLDRFARNQDDHVMVRAMLKRSGTLLRSVTEPINEEPIGRAMEGMISVFAELDNNIRTERTKAGMLERVRQGVWVWQCPLGFYRPTGASNIAPDPKVAHLIRLAFEEYAKGTYTYQSLATLLTERGLRTRYGNNPGAQLVEKILRNPLYKGAIEAFGEVNLGAFEGIVPAELYDSCQPNAKPTVHGKPRTRYNPLFPLRKVVRCSACCAALTGSSSRGHRGKLYPYYHHAKQGCPKASFIPKETLEQLFVEFLESVTPDAKWEKVFKAVVVDIWQNNYRKLDEQNARARGELQRLEQDRQRVFDLHRDGKYTDDEFSEQKTRINAEITRKHQLIQERRAEEFNMEEVLEYAFGFVRNTAQTWLRLADNQPARLRFQRLVIEGDLQFDGQKFGTADLSPIYAIKVASGGETSNLVPPRGIEPRLPG